jgi:uncharacterized membrane protein
LSIGRGRSHRSRRGSFICPIKITSDVAKTLGQGMFTPAIISLAIICILCGMALALSFRVLILVPVISVAVAMAVGVGFARGDAAESIGLRAATIAFGLQLGYSLSLGVWLLVSLIRENRRQSTSLMSSLRQRHLH